MDEATFDPLLAFDGEILSAAFDLSADSDAVVVFGLA
nr:hypothetical protein LGRDSM20601_p0030 [Listeria grayi]